MNNFLQQVLERKTQEVIQLKRVMANEPDGVIAQLMTGRLVNKSEVGISSCIKGDQLSVIAEVKRRSPSKERIGSINDPCVLVGKYLAGGANAISVLTDEKDFDGSLNDLELISNFTKNRAVAILRKDFIVDEVQIAESIASGASSILLIVAALKEKIEGLLNRARALGIDVLVEVHDVAELQLALEVGADMIGINNRNLHTLEVDIQRSFQLASLLPSHVIKVAASGIHSPQLAQELRNVGFDAVLVGEALVSSPDPVSFIQQMRKPYVG